MALANAWQQRSQRKLLAAQAFAYTTAAAMALDREGRLVDANLACRELFGVQLAGLRGLPIAELLKKLGAGPLGKAITSAPQFDARLSDDDLQPQTDHWQHPSPHYGELRLRWTLLPLVDPASGDFAGSLLQFEILQMDRAEEFRRQWERQVKHGLMWEMYATVYDRMLGVLPFYREVQELHVARHSAPGIDSVLDIGAGTGSVALPLLHSGRRVTAVDVSPAMLDRLIQKLDVSSAERLTLVEDSAESLAQFPANHFDGVNILLALYDMRDPQAALREAARVLKPGGTIVITDPSRQFDVQKLMARAEEFFRASPSPTLQADWEKILVIKQVLDDTIQQAQATSDQQGRAWSAEAAFDLLQRLGFKDLQQRVTYEQTCLTLAGRK